jgi:hypothetical protein
METLPSLDPQTLLPLLWTLLPIVLFIVLVPAIIFCVIVHRALARCAPSTRRMAPALVWLVLIPFVSLFWPFRVVGAVAASLHAEFVRRGMAAEPAPGKTLGTAYATLALLSAIPLVNFLTTLPAAVCWALYCVKIATLTRKLDESRAVIVPA